MSKVVSILTRLPHSDQGEVTLNLDQVRCEDECKKYKYYIIKYNVYRLNKKSHEIDLLGNIRYAGSKSNSHIKMIANDYELIILDRNKIFLKDHNDQIYLFNTDDEYA